MKITILSEMDYAASGHNLYEALKAHTGHDVAIYTGKYYNRYNHPQHTMTNRREAQRRIDNSDIVHLKGDFPPRNGYMGLKIMHKPIVVTVSGSHFRKKEYGGYEKYSPLLYKSALIRTSFEPDLLYPEYSTVWTPHPIDSAGKLNVWKNRGRLIHIPRNREMKNSDFLIAVMKGIAKKNNMKVEVYEKINFKMSKLLKERATIYFDQAKVGFYGNSALEAMQYGIPTVAWISPIAKKQAYGMLHDCPVITYFERNVDDWVAGISKIFENNIENLSKRTKEWCDDIHSYQAVAKQWNEIYAAV